MIVTMQTSGWSRGSPDPIAPLFLKIVFYCFGSLVIIMDTFHITIIIGFNMAKRVVPHNHALISFHHFLSKIVF